MKTKNLVIAGVVAVALLLGTGAGTASAQTPGDSNSTNAANASFSLFQSATQAVQFAGNSGDPVEYAIAYDIYVLSYLCYAITFGYNSGDFDLSDFLNPGAGGQFNVDAGVGYELALAVNAFSINLQAVGNPYASEIQFLASFIEQALMGAIQDDN